MGDYYDNLTLVLDTFTFVLDFYVGNSRLKGVFLNVCINLLQLYFLLQKSCRSPRGAKFNKERLAWDIIKADDITWNFEKFLINIDGVPVARFLPEKTPEYIFNLLVPLIISNWTSVYSLPDLLRERCQSELEIHLKSLFFLILIISLKIIVNVCNIINFSVD